MKKEIKTLNDIINGLFESLNAWSMTHFGGLIKVKSFYADGSGTMITLTAQKLEDNLTTRSRILEIIQQNFESFAVDWHSESGIICEILVLIKGNRS